jgi:hypothetical protein
MLNKKKYDEGLRTLYRKNYFSNSILIIVGSTHQCNFDGRKR